MRITKLYIKEYKNLKDFTWELNPASPIAVIVGKNASGKTNLLEAIIKIFQYLMLNVPKKKILYDFPSDFKITYLKGIQEDTKVHIEKEGDKVYFFVNDIRTKSANIVKPYYLPPTKEIIDIFPKRIFVYYAGTSKRLANITQTSTRQFIQKIRLDSSRYTSLSRHFVYFEEIHLQTIFYLLMQSSFPRIKYFLENSMNISTNQWTFGVKEGKKAKDIPDKFSAYKNFIYNMGRVTKEPLFEPIETGIPDLRESELYNEKKIFDMVDILYCLDVLESLFISFKLNEVQTDITIEDLSEGEKQKLAVWGIAEVFAGEETLFLLDEPDAFAHPRWQWDFIPDLQQAMGDNNFQQAIFVTHSPIVVSSLTEPAYVMENGKIEPMNPTFGNSVNETLAEQKVDFRKGEILDELKKYYVLIQEGKSNTDEAIRLREHLNSSLGASNSMLKYADNLISLYE